MKIPVSGNALSLTQMKDIYMNGMKALESGTLFLNTTQTLRDKSLAKKRLDICEECEYYKNYFCKKCGCVMAVKTKYKFMSCPVGKWGKEIDV